MHGTITHPERWGMIPSFIRDDRSLVEQFDERYVSGFRPHPDLTYEISNWDHVDHAVMQCTTYPDDKPYREHGRLVWGDETAILFDAGMVAIRSADGEWQVARMD